MGTYLNPVKRVSSKEEWKGEVRKKGRRNWMRKKKGRRGKEREREVYLGLDHLWTLITKVLHCSCEVDFLCTCIIL